ncbi:MAG: preprotein translocase subunit SecA, partial [Gemmatimonadales bacterium]
LHTIHKLLQAHALYEKDVDYLVQDGQVVIVDEFTGRVMVGRRWADGLHQAVEAKENVQVKGETQTLATVTIQNYFRMYEKLAGMTGTAETEETEFYSIYGLDVMVIPTNRPARRLDQPDRIYKTRREKNNAIIDETERLHEQGLPILIGTVNVDVSETLSRQLKRRGIRHEVLNAKYHQREAEIVANAGQKNSVTIATNMAGRGTDIKLGADLDLTAEEAGLQIIGTERHESRRIDRQLRGRSARQGDPGATVFFLSLEDDLMRLFISDRIAGWMDKSGVEEGEVITGRLVTRSIEQAQKRVELQNFQTRKRLLEYDDVMNQQREVIYALRLGALERGEELKAEARRMIQAALEQSVLGYLAAATRREEYDRGGLHDAMTLQYLLPVDAVVDADRTPDIEQIVEAVQEEGEQAFQRKLSYLNEFGETMGATDADLQILSQVMLSVLDEKWKDHLYDLDQLRNAIQYRAYGQRDPLVEYKREAFDMFEDLMRDVHSTFTERFLKIQVTAPPPSPRQAQAPVPRPTRTSASDDLFPCAASAPRLPPAGRQEGGAAGGAGSPKPQVLAGPLATGTVPEVGRNEPCPCGSGKKYKKCHGAAR